MFQITFIADYRACVEEEMHFSDEDDVTQFDGTSLTEVMLLACEAIDRNRVARFGLKFDQHELDPPLDIQTDFAIFMEQMPVLLSLAAPVSDARIRLFEQGTDLDLFFTLKAGVLAVEARSMVTNARVGLAEVAIVEFFAQIQAVRTVFLACCQQLVPELLRYPSFVEWTRLSGLIGLSL
jgi:hypothetical protein